MTIEVIWGSGSPFAWRVLLTLEVKGLAYESRLIQFSRGEQRSPEHLALNPRGKVPVLRDGAYVLSESLAIMACLDRRQPEPPLFGSTAEETGLVWQAILEFDNHVAPLLRRIVVPVFRGEALDAADMQAAAGGLDGELRRLAEAVAQHGWLVGARLSAADLAVYPFVEVLLRATGEEAVRAMGLAIVPLAERFPALEDWRQRITALPGYARTCPPHWRSGLKQGERQA
jgi:glutathione S-transferase